MSRDPLDDFTVEEFTADGKTSPVYVTGSGPAVIVIAEIPGITPLVASFARRVAAAGCTVFVPSLFGVDGLDPAKLARPGTFADTGRAVRLPVHMIDAYHKLSKAKRELEMLHGREATTDELAVSTGIAAAKIERMGGLLLDQAISLDRPVSDDDGRRVIDFLEDTEGVVPGENLEAEAISEQVRQVITLLRPIEADILRKRFGLDDDSDELTLKEIGEQYSLSRERIRQLQEQALGKIRRELKRREVV